MVCFPGKGEKLALSYLPLLPDSNKDILPEVWVVVCDPRRSPDARPDLVTAELQIGPWKLSSLVFSARGNADAG